MRFFKKLGKFMIFLFVVFLIGIIGIKIYIKLSPKVEINSTNSVFLYDKDEEVFFQGNESNSWISLDDISQYVIDATIYTEDKNFYKHNGFDYLRILKAFYVNLTSGSTQQGASTITQQYAKNLFLSFDKTWKRKWDEMWYTMKIEANYSKDEILEGYLNTINYGHGMYGIENASKYYFGKSAKDLDLAEATILTGIPKSPSNYSPLVNLEKAKERQLLILNLLVENEVISEEEKNNAYQEELKFLGEEERDEVTTVMYYHDAVKDEIENLTIDCQPKTLRDVIYDLPRYESGEGTDIAEVNGKPLYNHTVFKYREDNLNRIKCVPYNGGLQDIPDELLSNHLKKMKSGGYGSGGFVKNLYGRLDWDKPSGTIVAGIKKITCGRYFHPECNRLLTVREAARLQSFPDDYIVKGGMIEQYTVIGNAVPPKFSEIIGKALAKIFEDHQRR